MFYKLLFFLLNIFLLISSPQIFRNFLLCLGFILPRISHAALFIIPFIFCHSFSISVLSSNCFRSSSILLWYSHFVLLSFSKRVLYLDWGKFLLPLLQFLLFFHLGGNRNFAHNRKWSVSNSAPLYTLTSLNNFAAFCLQWSSQLQILSLGPAM
jgi:hypothetical protein